MVDLPALFNSVLITTAFSEPIRKFLVPIAEESGNYIATTIRIRTEKLLKKYEKEMINAEKGPEDIQRIPDKIAYQIILNGSLEEDDYMIDKWSLLLASAATASNTLQIHPSYPEILKELSPSEVKILDYMFDELKEAPKEKLQHYIEQKQIIDHFSLSLNEYGIYVDNLFRLRLISSPSTGPTTYGNVAVYQTKERITLTEYGYHFIIICRGPNK